MLLSFTNLAELHVLKSIREGHRVSLSRIRRAIDYLGRHFQSKHPLLEPNLLTDGRNIFVEQFCGLVSASESGPKVFDWVRLFLDRIERDSDGAPIRLFPFTDKARAQSPRSVAIDPRIRFGRPCIAGTNIPTAILAERHEAGDSVEALAEDYGRPERDIKAALEYERRSRPAA
jgi:uncharacterized protein (DUF433 family)